MNAFEDFEEEAFAEENMTEQRFSYSVSEVTEDAHHHLNPSYVINLNYDDSDEDDVPEISSEKLDSDFGYSSELDLFIFLL